jgi:nitrilase
MNQFVMAAIQAAPIHFDREASTTKACRLIAKAGDKGATIAAFGECWLPGYPMFAFMPPTPARSKADSTYLASTVKVPGPETARLCSAARKQRSTWRLDWLS